MGVLHRGDSDQKTDCCARGARAREVSGGRLGNLILSVYSRGNYDQRVPGGDTSLPTSAGGCDGYWNLDRLAGCSLRLPETLATGQCTMQSQFFVPGHAAVEICGWFLCVGATRVNDVDWGRFERPIVQGSHEPMVRQAYAFGTYCQWRNRPVKPENSRSTSPDSNADRIPHRTPEMRTSVGHEHAELDSSMLMPNTGERACAWLLESKKNPT
ncbi:hypothetical protein K440DRAFT_249029 [Wilcoxina mikolae CBS 423.85]|nr:hypothetical protein K440DRAFT_249029 [Wilcoxina mikolae CBS 423.85]